MSPPDKKHDGTIFTGTAEERMHSFLQAIGEKSQGKDWMNDLIPCLSVYSAQEAGPHPAVTFLITIQRKHCNALGNLHGGCTATLFDICTSFPIAFVARPGFWDRLGVSRTLSVSYLAPAREGDEVLIECELLQVGNKLATIKGTMRNRKDGTIIASCEHGKYNTGSRPKV